LVRAAEGSQPAEGLTKGRGCGSKEQYGYGTCPDRYRGGGRTGAKGSTQGIMESRKGSWGGDKSTLTPTRKEKIRR